MVPALLSGMVPMCKPACGVSNKNTLFINIRLCDPRSLDSPRLLKKKRKEKMIFYLPGLMESFVNNGRNSILDANNERLCDSVPSFALF